MTLPGRAGVPDNRVLRTWVWTMFWAIGTLTVAFILLVGAWSSRRTARYIDLLNDRPGSYHVTLEISDVGKVCPSKAPCHYSPTGSYRPRDRPGLLQTATVYPSLSHRPGGQLDVLVAPELRDVGLVPGTTSTDSYQRAVVQAAAAAAAVLAVLAFRLVAHRRLRSRRASTSPRGRGGGTRRWAADPSPGPSGS